MTVGDGDAEACVRCFSLYLRNEYSLNVIRLPTVFIFSCCCPPSAWLRPAQALTGRTGCLLAGLSPGGSGENPCLWPPGLPLLLGAPVSFPLHAVTRGLLSTLLCHQPRKPSAFRAGDWIRPTSHTVGDAHDTVEGEPPHHIHGPWSPGQDI